MPQSFQFPPPQVKFHAVGYAGTFTLRRNGKPRSLLTTSSVFETVNGQNFSGTDLAKLLTNEWLTDTFIERGIRAVLPIKDLEEGIALTVSAVWDWKQSQTKAAIEQRLKLSGGMGLIIRGSGEPRSSSLEVVGWDGPDTVIRELGQHFTLDLRFYGEVTGNYKIDSLPAPRTARTAQSSSKSAQPSSTSAQPSSKSAQPSSKSAQPSLRGKQTKAEIFEKAQIKCTQEDKPDSE
jgi:hypothetical protein